jgi:pimeloyl-ACP methyl ester carboxylesterase
MTLILLPGMDGTGILFQPFVAALGTSYSVKVVSYPSDVEMEYSELEAVARAALPKNEPFIIVGESFSGPIAVSLAASCSDQIKGVILCCSFVRNPYPFFSKLKSIAGALPIRIVPKAILNYFALGAYATESLKALLQTTISKVSPSVLRARLRAILSVNVTEKLSSLSVPVLYLRASRDFVVPSSASETVASLNQRVTITEIEAPHLLLQAAPNEAAQAVATFIKGMQTAL